LRLLGKEARKARFQEDSNVFDVRDRLLPVIEHHSIELLSAMTVQAYPVAADS
jgi:hypothetical protein